MPPRSSGPSITPLLVVTRLISSTAVDDLPKSTPRLLTALQSCSASSLVFSGNAAAKDASDAAVVAHKFKTQISTLLYGKSAAGRWTAIILVKATVEFGGWEILRASQPWLGALISLITKPGPYAIKSLCIITLTRIYLLARPYQTLLREIVTPVLPSFIQGCLSLVSAKTPSAKRHLQSDWPSPLLTPTLEAFGCLVPHFPGVFRPFAGQIRDLILPLLAPTPASVTVRSQGLTGTRADVVDLSTSTAARQLYVKLHHCAPRNSAGDEWITALRKLIRSIHLTCDRVFRAVKEDWQSTSMDYRPALKAFENIVCDAADNFIGLPSWAGVEAGMERLAGLLKMLQQFLRLPTPSTVTLPVGTVLDMYSRIFSIILPPSQTPGHDIRAVSSNSEIGREEREGLLIQLPQIHALAMESLTDFLHRVSEGASAVARAIFDQICWVFEAEEWSPDVRKQFYSNIAELLRMQGSSLSSTDMRLLSRIILRCCNDIDPTPTSSNQPAVAASTSTNSSKKANSRPAPSMNADNFTSSADPFTITPPSAFPGLYESAWALLPVFLTHTPSQVISFSSRTAIDRTAILVQHKEAMLASVLRPPHFKVGRKPPSSILPHLARAAGGELRVEGILRPRFPPIKSTSAQVNGDEDRDSDLASADDRLGPMYPEQNGTAEASTLDVPDPKLNNNSYLDLIAPSQPGNTTKAPSAHDFIALSREVQGEKRPVDAGSHSLDAQDHPSTKRIRIGSSAALDAVDISASQPDVATAPQPGHPQIEPQRLATTPKAAEYGNIEDDDDDDFEIPELVMDADTEDEDEGGEADEDGN